MAVKEKADTSITNPFVYANTSLIEIKDGELYKYYIGDFETHEQASKFKAEKQSTILSEIISLNQSLSQNIDTKTTTVGQLQSYRAEVNRQIEAQKKK